MTELEDFIKRRFPNNCHWTTGNCYWFAVILSHYCYLKKIRHTIVYDVINGHFMIYNYEDGMFYDFEGAHPNSQGYEVIWNKFEEYDALQYDRIVEDCIL